MRPLSRELDRRCPRQGAAFAFLESAEALFRRPRNLTQTLRAVGVVLISATAPGISNAQAVSVIRPTQCSNAANPNCVGPYDTTIGLNRPDLAIDTGGETLGANMTLGRLCSRDFCNPLDRAITRTTTWFGFPQRSGQFKLEVYWSWAASGLVAVQGDHVRVTALLEFSANDGGGWSQLDLATKEVTTAGYFSQPTEYRTATVNSVTSPTLALAQSSSTIQVRATLTVEVVNCTTGCNPSSTNVSGSIGVLDIRLRVCAVPTNFRQTNQNDDGNGVIHFWYAWDSSTGTLGDLWQCQVGERVDYSPHPFPSPPFNPTSPQNPTITSQQGHLTPIEDIHSNILPFVTPYSAVTTVGTQVYRYSCPCALDSWVTLAQQDIVRSFSQNPDGSWRFTITKSGLSSIIYPLP